MKCVDGHVEFIRLETVIHKYLYISHFIYRLEKKNVLAAFHKLKRINILHKLPGTVLFIFFLHFQT